MSLSGSELHEVPVEFEDYGPVADDKAQFPNPPLDDALQHRWLEVQHYDLKRINGVWD